mgnify:CR=1 FL=1
MIYHHKSPEFQGYLSSGKHTPTTEEVIDALQDLKKKMPGLGAVDLANAHRRLDEQPAVEEKPADDGAENGAESGDAKAAGGAEVRQLFDLFQEEYRSGFPHLSEAALRKQTIDNAD